MAELENSYINKKCLIINLIITLVVLIVGLILIESGYNEAFESTNDTIREIFAIITKLGDDLFWIIILALIIFGVNKKFGRQSLVLFMISLFFNNLFKDFFKDPRPHNYHLDPDLGYGFPSGHTQHAITFWGFSLIYSKNSKDKINKAAVWNIVFLLLIILLPISRLVIGVHDLEDVVGGFVIGMVILNLYLILLPKITKLKEKPIGLKILMGFGIVFAIWIACVLGFPESNYPEMAYDLGQAAGILMAASIFFPIEEKYIKFEPAQLPMKKRVISAIIGLIFTIILYFGLSILFEELSGLPWLLRCIRYFILGGFLIICCPFIIKKFLKIE